MTGKRAVNKAGDLTRERVVEAAQALVHAAGVDSLSMRQLAGELGVTATALYYHVGSKDALLDEVFCALMKTADREPGALPWDVALEDLLVRLQYLAAGYPGIQRWMADHLESRATLSWMEMILKILKSGGFSDEHAVIAMNVVGFYNSPVPLRAHGPIQTGPWEDTHSEAIALTMQSIGEGFPNLKSALPYLRPPHEGTFRSGLKSLIVGLER
jgi:AcrR family transcriptional regulator